MKNLKIGDKILLIGIPLLAVVLVVCFVLFSLPGDVAVITLRGEEICRLPLDQDTRKEINGGTHVIVVEKGQVHIDKADCKDGQCTDSPPISSQGEAIVCLPYELVVTIQENGS